jgi:hypothetical protein
MICLSKAGGQVEGTSRFDLFDRNDARNAPGIQKRKVKKIPKTIDPKMV